MCIINNDILEFESFSVKHGIVLHPIWKNLKYFRSLTGRSLLLLVYLISRVLTREEYQIVYSMISVARAMIMSIKFGPATWVRKWDINLVSR